MDKIEKIIQKKYYEIDCLKAYKQIITSGCCNDCAINNKCDYCPKVGELVRYNCPFYKKKITD